MPPSQSERPLTVKQQAVLDYVREHQGVTQEDLARAMRTTLRGAGVTLSALLWRDDVPIYPQRPEGALAGEVRWYVS